MTGNTGFINRIESFAKYPASLLTGQLGTLGRLGFKEEAAGKIRVFAMVDPWTQWLMKPLWDHIVQVLQLIPQDGTKDQLKPLHRLIRTCPKGPYFSYDLSAATDRLPVTLQVQLLAPLLGAHGANLWRILLTGRLYRARYRGENLGDFAYGAGQPMGALTS